MSSIDLKAEHVREREGGYCFTVYGESRFVEKSQIEALTSEGAYVRVTLARSAFRRLIARPKNVSSPRLPPELCATLPADQQLAG